MSGPADFVEPSVASGETPRARDIAEELATILVELGAAPRPRLVTAGELATFLDVEPDWVYANAARLGAWRLGDGPRARLRFDLVEVERRLTACSGGRESAPGGSGMVERKEASRRRRRSGTGVPLLPVRGSE
jgi:hypothetical protein